MMMNHQPLFGGLKKEIGGLRLPGSEALIKEGCDIFRALDPSDFTNYLDEQIRYREPHTPRVAEYLHPTLSYIVPTYNKLRTRMHTPHPAFMQPQFFHCFNI